MRNYLLVFIFTSFSVSAFAHTLFDDVNCTVQQGNHGTKAAKLIDDGFGNLKGQVQVGDIIVTARISPNTDRTFVASLYSNKVPLESQEQITTLTISGNIAFLKEANNSIAHLTDGMGTSADIFCTEKK